MIRDFIVIVLAGAVATLATWGSKTAPESTPAVFVLDDGRYEVTIVRTDRELSEADVKAITPIMQAVEADLRILAPK